MKKVITIMPTYNLEKYVRQAIESVLKQKLHIKHEILICDDYSTDNTPQIIREYADKYPDVIRFYRQKENVGLTENYCSAFEKLDGDYFAFCDGDDYYTDDFKLQKQIDFLENHPDYGFVFTGYDSLNEKTDKLIPWQKKNYSKEYLNFLAENAFNNILSSNSYIFHGLTFLGRQILLDKYLALNEVRKQKQPDICIFLEFAKHSKMGIIDSSTCVYRARIESATNNEDIIKKILFSTETWKIRKFYAEKYRVNTELKKHINYNLHRISLHIAYLNSDKIEARKAFNEMIKAGIKYLKISDLIKFIIINLKFVN